MIGMSYEGNGWSVKKKKNWPSKRNKLSKVREREKKLEVRGKSRVGGKKVYMNTI